VSSSRRSPAVSSTCATGAFHVFCTCIFMQERQVLPGLQRHSIAPLCPAAAAARRSALCRRRCDGDAQNPDENCACPMRNFSICCRLHGRGVASRGTDYADGTLLSWLSVFSAHLSRLLRWLRQQDGSDSKRPARRAPDDVVHTLVRRRGGIEQTVKPRARQRRQRRIRIQQ